MDNTQNISNSENLNMSNEDFLNNVKNISELVENMEVIEETSLL